MIKFNPKGFWEQAFKEEYSPCFSKTVKGYTFIGAHWPGIGDLGEWLAANGKSTLTFLLSSASARRAAQCGPQNFSRSSPR